MFTENELTFWAASPLTTHLDLAVRAATIWNCDRMKKHHGKFMLKLLIESMTHDLCSNFIN